MKLGLVWVVLAAVAVAAPPINPTALSVEVRQENVDRSKTNWRTDFGSFSRDFINKRFLAVKLRTVGECDRRVVLEWYFIGQYADGGGGLALYGAGAANCLTGGADARTYTIASNFTTHFKDRYQALRLTVRDGVKPFGWVVLVWQGQRLLKWQGSVPELARDYAETLRPMGPPVVKT